MNTNGESSNDNKLEKKKKFIEKPKMKSMTKQKKRSDKMLGEYNESIKQNKPEKNRSECDNGDIKNNKDIEIFSDKVDDLLKNIEFTEDDKKGNQKIDAEIIEAKTPDKFKKMDSEIQQNADRIRSIGEEILGNERLENLLKNKPIVKAYDGFEPSGRMHIAQGLIRTINVNKFTQSGVKFVFWVADYFALLNLKMGGDLSKIRKAGELMIHTWKACGMDMDNVEFIWSSDEIIKRSEQYWKLVFDIATKFNVKRILRCTQIMGRKDFSESDSDNQSGDKTSDQPGESNNVPYEDMLTSMKISQIFYPAMQCADVLFLGIDICSLGMDQRKVNMLVIEYCEMIKKKLKPIIVSHHMLSGLDGSDKMAKSNPDSAIFMDDTDAEIDSKIKKAFCEPGNVVKNPILEYFKYIVFEKESNVGIPIYDTITKTTNINKYTKFEDLQKDFADQKIHPNDLKLCIRSYLKIYLEPVRKYFSENPKADALRKEVKKFASAKK
jgi:tyrosyl-tRNA synthetase